MNKKLKAKKVMILLSNEYGLLPPGFLDFRTDAQLLCAIILSAQSTDAQVNKVTKTLFKKYKSPKDFAFANIFTFKKEIFSTGFYNSKAKNIISCFKKIIDVYDGKIPENMKDLISLSGVGRKTANIYLSKKNIIVGIAVDTHVARLSKRIGFSKEKYANKIESDLMRCFEKKDWNLVNRLLISHGRTVCTARKPNCNDCILAKEKLCSKINLPKSN